MSISSHMFYAAFVVAIFCLQPAQQDDKTHAMIKKLGSTSFKERQAATDWLLQRTEATAALRVALKSSEPEIAKRAAFILDYFDSRPVRDLEGAIRRGAVNQIIDILAAWRQGKHEMEAWRGVCELSRTLAALHKKKGGADIDCQMNAAEAPVLTVAHHFSEALEAVEGNRFVRAADVVWRDRGASRGTLIIASGSVKIPPAAVGNMTVLARGSIEMKNATVSSVIVSQGDVTISGIVSKCLIIAKGNIRLLSGGFVDSQIIAGKSVVYNKKNSTNSIITENDLNPLGFIRWTDASKKKAAPTGK